MSAKDIALLFCYVPQAMSSPASAPNPPVPRRFRILAGVFLVVVAAAVVQWIRRPPLLPIPLPRDAASLDSQVKAHLDAVVEGVRQEPRSATRRATLAIAYAANGLWNEARQAFLDTARLDPDEPLARMYAAVALEELADLPAALREFQALTIQDPGFAPGWYRVGECALRTGDLGLAETAFTRLTTLAPDEWRGPAGLGEVRIRQGRAPEAVPLLEKSLELDAAAKPARFLLGQAYRSVGRTNEARVALAAGSASVRHPMADEWSELAPLHMKSIPDQLVQAEELCSAGRPDVAVPLLAEALRFHPDHPGLSHQQAMALNQMGQPDKALPMLDRLIAKDPKAVAPWITRSYTQVLLGRHEQGLSDARSALALATNSSHAHIAAANAWLAMDKDAEAIAAVREAKRCDPRNPEIALELGNILWRNLNDTNGALAQFEHAIEIDPSQPRALAMLGFLSLEAGNTNRARTAVDQLGRLAPQSAEYRELRAALQKR